jgi:hypothetical protein
MSPHFLSNGIATGAQNPGVTITRAADNALGLYLGDYYGSGATA